MAEVCPKTGFGAALMALPNRFVEALEIVEVEVVLPKAGGAVVGGAEVGAIEEEALLLLVIAPNPPNVGVAFEAAVGCEEDVVVVAMEPKEGVLADVIEDPNDGTALLALEVPPMVLPNVGAVAADDDDGVPKAKEVEPAPNAGTAGAGAALVFTGVAVTTAALVVSLGAVDVAAPPNENPTPLAVVAAVVVVAAAVATTGFDAPKLNPPATTGADALVVAVVAAGGLNALNPLDGPPKVIVVGVTCDVAEVVVVVAGAAVPKVKLDCEEVGAAAGLLVVAANGAGEKLIRFGVEAGGFVGCGAV